MNLSYYKGDTKMIRTTKQLQAQLKDGYTIKNYGYKVTGTETCIVSPTGRKSSLESWYSGKPSETS